MTSPTFVVRMQFVQTPEKEQSDCFQIILTNINQLPFVVVMQLGENFVNKFFELFQAQPFKREICSEIFL